MIEAIAAGATGYLEKYSRPEELTEAVGDVAEGQLRIPDEAVRQVFAMVRGERGLAPAGLRTGSRHWSGRP